MILASAKLKIPRFNMRNLRLGLKKDGEMEFKNAVEAWLRAVLKKVPVYTGTSRGTFAPVGRVIDKAVLAMGPVSGTAASKKKFSYKGQDFPLGFGAGAQYGDAQLSVKSSFTNIEFRFTFSQGLLYAVWNEIQPAPSWLNLTNPTPWNARIAGRDAFLKYTVDVINKKFGNPTTDFDIP